MNYLFNLVFVRPLQLRIIQLHMLRNQILEFGMNHLNKKNTHKQGWQFPAKHSLNCDLNQLVTAKNTAKYY